VSDKIARRGRWILASITAAALATGAAARMRARRSSGQPDAPADVGFMRALHAALRRDLSRLRDAAAQLDSSAGAPATVLAGRVADSGCTPLPASGGRPQPDS